MADNSMPVLYPGMVVKYTVKYLTNISGIPEYCYATLTAIVAKQMRTLAANRVEVFHINQYGIDDATGFTLESIPMDTITVVYADLMGYINDAPIWEYGDKFLARTD